MPQRRVNDKSDTFQCDGSQCSDALRYYKDLPEHLASRFPMRGTFNILSTSKPNSLYLSHPMVVYYFLETAYSNETTSLRGWIDTGYFGEYLGDGIYAKIFKKIMPSGLHIMDTRLQALLFTRSGICIHFKTFLVTKPMPAGNSCAFERKRMSRCCDSSYHWLLYRLIVLES